MKLKLLLFALLFSLSAYSQWGVKAGLDYGTLSGAYATKYKVGFHAGATYDFKLSEKFYFQPAALFSLHSFGFDGNKLFYLKDGTVDRYFLEIPANFSFRPAITSSTKLVIDFGLYAKYGLFGKLKYIVHSEDNYETVRASSYDEYNRFDVGVNVGVGMEINRIYIGLGYQRGLTNEDGEVEAFRNQIFRISCGYKF
ncbi:MAG: PorT family protein [Prevotella sp.]|jgi:hypothetical protein|nr:PorT family protein [Prevotella sp.]